MAIVKRTVDSFTFHNPNQLYRKYLNKNVHINKQINKQMNERNNE